MTSVLPSASDQLVLRPARLNVAGWCIWCLERYCDSARCIRLHEGSRWMVCPECDGSESIDEECFVRCRSCRDGVVEAAFSSGDVDAPLRVVTDIEPRNDAAGLVPRSEYAGPAWDYSAAARRWESECDPALVAAAKANPADRTAGFRAYGMSY